MVSNSLPLTDVSKWSINKYSLVCPQHQNIADKIGWKRFEKRYVYGEKNNYIIYRYPINAEENIQNQCMRCYNNDYSKIKVTGNNFVIFR